MRCTENGNEPFPGSQTQQISHNTHKTAAPLPSSRISCCCINLNKVRRSFLAGKSSSPKDIVSKIIAPNIIIIFMNPEPVHNWNRTKSEEKCDMIVNGRRRHHSVWPLAIRTLFQYYIILCHKCSTSGCGSVQRTNQQWTKISEKNNNKYGRSLLLIESHWNNTIRCALQKGRPCEKKEWNIREEKIVLKAIRV